MAKMKYLSASGVLDEIATNYTSGEGGFTTEGKQTAVWTIDGSENTITFSRQEHEVRARRACLGSVDKVMFEDFEGADFAVMTGKFKAATLGKAIDTQKRRRFY